MFCTSMGTAGWLMMGGLWLTVVVVILWAIFAATRGPARSGVDALAVIDDRLARGEIDPEEYRRLRSTLEEAR